MILSILLVCLPSAHAQVGNKDKGKKITFVCASWNPLNEKLYYLKGGTSKNPEYEKVSISEMVRSLPHVAKEGSSATFYKLNSSVEYLKVGQVSIPAGSKRYLLLFMPKKGTEYQIMAIPDERKHSPFGAYSFYNFSKLPVHGLLAKTKFEVASGKQKLVQLNLKPGTPWRMPHR